MIRKASGETLDLRPYEADMRHLIDMYIDADVPRTISPFDKMSLLEIVVKTGIAEAISSLPDGLKSSKDAVAETIENNVRSKIIKEHLSDPALYENMSTLLDEIIVARKAKATEYEEYLKRIAALAKKVEAGIADDTPSQLNTPGRRALYNNLKQQAPAGVVNRAAAPSLNDVLDLAIRIDNVVKHIRPDDWRGVQAREQVIKSGLYGVLQDVGEVERIFLIIKAQSEY